MNIEKIKAENETIKQEVDSYEAQADEALSRISKTHPDYETLTKERESNRALYLTQVIANWQMYQDALSSKDYSETSYGVAWGLDAKNAIELYSFAFRKASSLMIENEKKFLSHPAFGNEWKKKVMVGGAVIGGVLVLHSLIGIGKGK